MGLGDLEKPLAKVLEVGLEIPRLEDLIIRAARGRVEAKTGVYRGPLSHDE